jgi:catechol 2,3-dioxygenase-like lactoylglutathione lyase family enzyme
MPSPNPRRAFIKQTLAAGAALAVPSTAAGGGNALERQTSGIGALDHVAVPMQNVEAMIAFYRTLGFAVREGASIVSVHFADQKINFHRPSLWQRETFTLRAPAAEPPCGDFCWVWLGSEGELRRAIERVGAAIETEGQRDGGRDGGNAVGQSLYIRDPDGNLLEFIRYA